VTERDAESYPDPWSAPDGRFIESGLHPVDEDEDDEPADD
jgi:hypothetical protein